MPIYRSIPRFIVAYQYDGDFKDSSGKYYAPSWVVQAFESDYLFYKDAGELYIRGDIVNMHVSVGDYLIRNDDGTISKLDAEEFEGQYVKELEVDDGSAMDVH